jgi:hypothetical protein
VHALGNNFRVRDVVLEQELSDMRVAFLVLTLLAVASSEASHSQAMERPEAPAFNGGVPALAMNYPQLDLTGTKTSVMVHGVNVPQSVPQNVNVSQNPPAAATSAHPPMAGRGAALIQPLSGMRPAGQPTRSITDHLLTGLVAVMLIAYQLRRKHRVLRPHPFTN